MLEVGLIGIGNAGNQVAALAKDKLGIDVYAINSSEKDFETIPAGIPKKLMGDKKGAGKNRSEAKNFLKSKIMELISDEEFQVFMKTKEVVYVCSSTGGGTGSGMAPILSSIITQSFKNEDGTDKVIILIGILPTLLEAYSTQVNTLEYLTELYKTLEDPTYMLYDNEKLSKKSTCEMMTQINASIVNDISVMMGRFTPTTPYASIDEKDMKVILNTQGRIAIASLVDMKEKDLDTTDVEDLIINEIKVNTHCELQRDKTVHRTGIITNLSQSINATVNTHIPKVQDFIGSPVEEFEHIYVNAERKLPNNVFLIMAGLTRVNDRVHKINDRIEEIEERQRQLDDDDDALSDNDIDELNSKRNYRKSSENSDVNLQDIFSKFNA